VLRSVSISLIMTEMTYTQRISFSLKYPMVVLSVPLSKQDFLLSE